jgi:hypothetical protein
MIKTTLEKCIKTLKKNLFSIALHKRKDWGVDFFLTKLKNFK